MSSVCLTKVLLASRLPGAFPGTASGSRITQNPNRHKGEGASTDPSLGSAQAHTALLSQPMAARWVLKACSSRVLARFLFRSIFLSKTMIVRAALSASALLLGLIVPAHSQPPGPPKPPGEGRSGEPGRRHGGDWRGLGSPGLGRPPMRSEEYEKLPEEDRKHIREALDRVWWRPEVMQARERAMKAHSELRQTIRQELEKTDPKAAAILAKVEARSPEEGGEGLAPLPALDSEEYPRQMLARFGREMMAFSKPERQEDAKRFHERISALPMLQEAVRQAQSVRGEERIQAIQRLRALYRETVMREFQALKDRRPPPPEAGKVPPTNP